LSPWVTHPRTAGAEKGATQGGGREPPCAHAPVRETKGYNESFNPARGWMLVKSDA